MALHYLTTTKCCDILDKIFKYTSIKFSDTLGYVVAIIEADEVNLFGEKPIMSYFVCDSSSEVFVAYGNRMYLDSKNIWEAELR
ncbi:MAG: hypothetical protein IKB01_05090 [Lachnospiraceae bacterium]|nr:hypothetical protein [Lachnospiraceae bacterium]MBR4084081.1 hypothetical protein [Lachnospiraceae bacterium]